MQKAVAVMPPEVLDAVPLAAPSTAFCTGNLPSPAPPMMPLQPSSISIEVQDDSIGSPDLLTLAGSTQPRRELALAA